MKNSSYVLSVLFVLVVLLTSTGCAIPKDAKPAATPANQGQEMTISDPNSGDVRLVNELKTLRLELEQLRASNGGGNGGQGTKLAQPANLITGAGPSATVVSDGTGIMDYVPKFSAAIPSRTVYLPGELRHFVSYEGNGGWAPCIGYERLWHPVNMNGRPVMALTGMQRGCIVATDCPMTDPEGKCEKQLTIYWLERSNPTWIVNQRTVTVQLQMRPLCASIGNGCLR